MGRNKIKTFNPVFIFKNYKKLNKILNNYKIYKHLKKYIFVLKFIFKNYMYIRKNNS